MKFKYVYQAEAGAGEGGGGAAPVVITPEQFAAVQESVSKLELKNKELLQEKAEAKKAAEKAVEDSARKSGDVEALEKSWREKLANEVATRDGQLSAYQQTISDMTVGAAARTMAAELALPGSADVLLPHIEKRMKVEMTDGVAVVRILDKAGKPSAMSIDDLKKEMSAEKSFAPLLVGSHASGSGNPGVKGGTTAKTIKRSDFDKMSMSEQDKFVTDGGKPIDA